MKDEAWWLVLGNIKTSELFSLKRVSFSNSLMTKMDLPEEVDFQVIYFLTILISLYTHTHTRIFIYLSLHSNSAISGAEADSGV